MKKIILFAAAMLLVVSSVSAQRNGGVYTPKKGDITVDLRLSSPFNNNNDGFISSESAMTQIDFLQGDGINVRYFLNEKFAIKGIFSIFNAGDKLFDDHYDETNRSYEKYSFTAFTLGAGIEYRLGSFNKFYPYAGVGVGVGVGSQKNTDVHDVDGDPIVTNTNKSNSTGAMININLGADYYLSNHFFVGFEVGLNYTNIWDNGTDVVHTNTEHNLRTYCVPSLRMGWKF